MKSVMFHRFSEAPQANISRSVFERNHGYKTTFDAGLLIPFFIDEALPGDTLSYRLSAFARLATPIYPIMDNMRLETFFFSVPLRLVWDNFKKMMGERVDPDDSIEYTVPQISIDSVSNHSLTDYFGLPTQVYDALYGRLDTV